MENKELTYNDFLQRLDIRDVLLDAGYHQNRRFGLRLPSFIRMDSEGKRIRGDKFVITKQGKCCTQPPRQREYNVVSFIKGHPLLFAEYREGMDLDRLVNLVCSRLLNRPVVQSRQDIRPFHIADYDLHKFDPRDRETQKKFHLYFKNRGIDLSTQYAFHRHFCLATKYDAEETIHTCLAFPLTLPKGDGTVVGFEERDCVRIDGSSNYQDKAEEGNTNEGLWIVSPAQTPLAEAKHVYWFESAYDAMAYYQLHQAQNKDLRKAVFISTGGAPSQQQFKGAIKATPHASHHLCFDHDRAGQVYAIHFALTHAGWNFSTCLSQTGRLIVQNNSEDYSQYEIELEPFNFEKITAILGINDAKQNLKNGERDDMGIGDGYLQEMRMVCMDEYDMARDEGSASEEELEKMRSNLEAIEKAIDASISGPEATGCILYESAAEGYKDWNDQLLGKRIKPEKDNLDDWEISGKATLNHALSDLPEVNPEHIRNGLYDEADHEAVRKRLERADRVIFSFETNDQGMSDKGFQEMYKIREELARLEVDITNSLSGMREDFHSRFHR